MVMGKDIMIACMRWAWMMWLALLPLTAVAQVGELPRSAPDEQDVPTALLNHFYRKMASLPQVDIHHMMVLRHGKVIGEVHAAPYRATDLHTLYSASKTVTALAVGLAVDDGLLTVDDKVSKHVRDKMPATLSPQLERLTVRDVLMMASGRLEDLKIFEGEEDWLTAWFRGEFGQAGKEFHYDSMCTHLLATIVTRLAGMPMLDYVRERIFRPMHITTADWELAPDGVEAAGWGLRLHAESEAKLGQLMLQQGIWNGRQLVSRQWIKEMTLHRISTQEPAQKLPLVQRIVDGLRRLWHTIRSWFTGYNVDHYYLGYGYQTKSIQNPRSESFFAAGYGGQLIYVVPKLDMVVVVNGRAANYGRELNTIYYSLVEPLIAGITPDNDADTVDWSIAPPRGQDSHTIENRLWNKTITLDDNVLGLQSVMLSQSGSNRIFTMNDRRGALRAVTACGQWHFTTSDDRPIYIMESREQLVGTQRPFTTVAAYAWRGDTLSMRMDWLDGGDNRRMDIAFDGDAVTVMVNDNFDPLLSDTIAGKILPAP